MNSRLCEKSAAMHRGGNINRSSACGITIPKAKSAVQHWRLFSVPSCCFLHCSRGGHGVENTWRVTTDRAGLPDRPPSIRRRRRPQVPPNPGQPPVRRAEDMLLGRPQLASDPPRRPVGFERIGRFAFFATEHAPPLAAGRRRRHQNCPAFRTNRSFGLTHRVNLPSDSAARPFQMRLGGKNTFL